MFRLIGQTQTAEVCPGSDYTEPEWEFIKAMDQYQRQFRRRFPTWREVLHVLRGLGYRRIAKPTAIGPLPLENLPEPTEQDLDRIRAEEAANPNAPTAS